MAQRSRLVSYLVSMLLGPCATSAFAAGAQKGEKKSVIAIANR